MNDPTFKVSVSGYALNRKIPPGDLFWKDFNGSFQNKTLSCPGIGRQRSHRTPVHHLAPQPLAYQRQL